MDRYCNYNSPLILDFVKCIQTLTIGMFLSKDKLQFQQRKKKSINLRFLSNASRHKTLDGSLPQSWTKSYEHSSAQMQQQCQFTLPAISRTDQKCCKQHCKCCRICFKMLQRDLSYTGILDCLMT